MKKDSENRNNQHYNWSDFDQLNEKLNVSWEEPKEDIWMQMSQKMSESVAPKTIYLWERPAFRYAIAAMVVLFIGIGSIARFYTKSFETISGQHLAVNLPDGSTATLNAESSISYHPYWWSISREVEFEGEAYFEVEKGSKFSVNSSKGTTSVLGTSFNIFSRDNSYRVACLTGKVKVVDTQGLAEVILNPEEKAELKEGSFEKYTVNTNDETAWVNNQFVFTGAPIREVFDEIERQYGVKINSGESFEFEYSGNFSREQSVSQVLNYVCRSFNLKFEESNNGEYQVSSNN